MVEIIEILRQEHRNIEKLLRVMEQELSVFDRGERPDYEVFGAVIEFFKKYPDSCHHPKEDIIYGKFKARALIEQRQLLTLKRSIAKVRRDCASSLKRSTVF
jgi:hemerythrin-like domain-containing protein